MALCLIELRSLDLKVEVLQIEVANDVLFVNIWQKEEAYHRKVIILKNLMNLYFSTFCCWMSICRVELLSCNKTFRLIKYQIIICIFDQFTLK